MAPCPPRLHPDPSRSERAKMLLKKTMKIVTAHFPLAPSPLRRATLFLKDFGESPARGSRRASQPHSTAGFICKAVPETQPHQPRLEIFQTHPHDPSKTTWGR